MKITETQSSIECRGFLAMIGRPSDKNLTITLNIEEITAIKKVIEILQRASKLQEEIYSGLRAHEDVFFRAEVELKEILEDFGGGGNVEKQEFQTKIREIAELIGYEVEIPEEQYYNNAKLTKNSIIINIRNGGWKSENKINISGSYPHDCHGGISYHGLKNPSIGCSQDKTAEQIVRDIQKRFLPSYLEDLQKVTEMNKREQEHNDAKYNVLKTLGGLIGTVPKKSDNRNEWSLEYWNRLEGLHGLEVNYTGERVDLELELSPDQAVQVLTLLKSFVKPNESNI